MKGKNNIFATIGALALLVLFCVGLYINITNPDNTTNPTNSTNSITTNTTDSTNLTNTTDLVNVTNPTNSTNQNPPNQNPPNSTNVPKVFYVETDWSRGHYNVTIGKIEEYYPGYYFKSQEGALAKWRAEIYVVCTVHQATAGIYNYVQPRLHCEFNEGEGWVGYYTMEGLYRESFVSQNVISGIISFYDPPNSPYFTEKLFIYIPEEAESCTFWFSSYLDK